MTRKVSCCGQTRQQKIWLASLFGLALMAWPLALSGQNVRAREDSARVLTVEKLTVTDGVVTGEVSNRSTRLLRDVQIFVRHTWLWDDEQHPGKSDPGTSTYYTLSK